MQKCKYQHFYWQRGRNCRRRTNLNMSVFCLFVDFKHDTASSQRFQLQPTTNRDLRVQFKHNWGHLWRGSIMMTKKLMLKYFWLCQICITLRSKIRYTDRKSLGDKISFVTRDFLMNFRWWTLRRLLQRWGQSSRKFWAVCGSLSGPLLSGRWVQERRLNGRCIIYEQD